METTLDLDRRYRLADDVAARTLGGEAVVVTPSDSKVHELDPVGTVALEACDGRRTVREVAALVTQSFDVAPEVAERDVAQFLELLAARGILARAE
jgi:predicted deacylase